MAKLVAVTTAVLLMLGIVAGPVGASQKADLAWAHRWGPHLKGVENDLIAAERSAVNDAVAPLLKECRQLDADVSNMLTNEPQLPGHAVAWTKDLLALQAAGVLCISKDEAGASVAAEQAIATKGLSTDNKLLKLLPHSFSFKGRAVHIKATDVSVAPAPTTTTAPPATASKTTSPPTTPPATSPPATTAPPPPPTTAPAAAPSCSASMSDSSPADYVEDTVNITSNVPDAPVLITKHYKTVTSTDTGDTDSGGSTSIDFYDSGATPGFTVLVDVSINSGQATCSTSFTPQ